LAAEGEYKEKCRQAIDDLVSIWADNNLLLRQLQFLAPEIGFGKYCWNGECRYCEVTYRRESDGAELSALACRVKGFPGMCVTKLAAEVRYNLSLALARAQRAPR